MKKNSNIVCRIAAGLVPLIFLALPANVVAGIAVSPMQQWVEVKPGKEAFFTLTITNVNRGTETRPSAVDVNVVDFAVSSEGALSFGEELKHDRSAAGWIRFEAGEFTLDPGESKGLKAKVSAPPNADGDYWAAIMVCLVNPKRQEKGVNVVLRTASGVFVHVARRSYVERGSVIDANVIMPKFDSYQNFGEESGHKETPAERVLKVSTSLKNDGLVAVNTSAKAILYSANDRRTASIPLYARRRQILPGDTRYFSGVMSQPLPAGQYKMKLFFESDSKYSRKISKDLEFSVSDELARQWVDSFKDSGAQILGIEPNALKLTLTAGRFTTTQFTVANSNLSTVSVHCRQEKGGLPSGWLELKSSAEFTLDLNMHRSVACAVRVPPDTKPGEYKGIINVEVDSPGLVVKGKDKVELHKIPISITVNK